MAGSYASLEDGSQREWDSVDGDVDSVAKLEAEQAKYAAQPAALRREDEITVSAVPAYLEHTATENAGQALAEENARLKEQLAAMASASAHRSTVRRQGEYTAQLEKYTAENAKLTAALASGAGLSELTAVRPSARVIAASHARSVSLVRHLQEAAQH